MITAGFKPVTFGFLTIELDVSYPTNGIVNIVNMRTVSVHIGVQGGIPIDNLKRN